MHIRYVCIRRAQYTDNWTCHLHKESRFTTLPSQTLDQHLNYVYHPYTHTSPVPHTSISITLGLLHSISIHTCNTNNSASQSQQLPHPNRVPRQPHRLTNDDHMTTDTTQAHRPNSKTAINLIILQVKII